ncbi:MAG: zeta toxin family protein [Aliarcobacter sp.]
MKLSLDHRPVIVALAGSNGAGKTTFYHAHLLSAGLRFINADVLARELSLSSYAAADVAEVLRRQLMERGESFVFETVFSDPVGDKLAFLQSAVAAGYNVVLCFVGISGPAVSEERVAMRVSQGGHDVPAEKLVTRFPRTMTNLKTAIRDLPHVWIFDNDDLRIPFRHVAVFESGQPAYLPKPTPGWLIPLLQSP